MGPSGCWRARYLAEYGRTSRISTVIRFVNDVLLSAPSIIVGLFVYEVLVVPMGHFSALAGAVALAVIAMPVTVRTTEDMLNLVPQGMKDASTAMGAYPWRTITSVIYPAARSGVVTGLLLAVARISGETAPLLFTALNNQFWSNNLNAPMANLPVVIFQFALSPYADWQRSPGPARCSSHSASSSSASPRASRCRSTPVAGADEHPRRRAGHATGRCERGKRGASTTCATSISTTADRRRSRTSI